MRYTCGHVCSWPKRSDNGVGNLAGCQPIHSDLGDAWGLSQPCQLGTRKAASACRQSCGQIGAVELTGTGVAAEALAGELDADFADEGQRFTHRAALSALFSPWFARHRAEDIATALSGTSILWERYRSFAEAAADPKVTANPLFTALTQPGIGEYLAPGLPFSVDGQRSAAVASPALGDDTAAVLSDLGIAADEHAAAAVGSGARSG